MENNTARRVNGSIEKKYVKEKQRMQRNLYECINDQYLYSHSTVYSTELYQLKLTAPSTSIIEAWYQFEKFGMDIALGAYSAKIDHRIRRFVGLLTI